MITTVRNACQMSYIGGAIDSHNHHSYYYFGRSHKKDYVEKTINFLKRFLAAEIHVYEANPNLCNARPGDAVDLRQKRLPVVMHRVVGDKSQPVQRA